MYRSTLHRVVNLEGRERYSVPFFFEPNFEAVVEPLPQVGWGRLAGVDDGEGPWCSPVPPTLHCCTSQLTVECLRCLASSTHLAPLLLQCCQAQPAKYPPTTSGQHLLDRYAATHSGYAATHSGDAAKMG